MFEKTLLSLATEILEERKKPKYRERERCARVQYTSSNGEILRNIFTNFSIKGDTLTEAILKGLVNKQLCKSVQLTDIGENLRNKKAKKKSVS